MIGWRKLREHTGLPRRLAALRCRPGLSAMPAQSGHDRRRRGHRIVGALQGILLWPQPHNLANSITSALQNHDSRSMTWEFFTADYHTGCTASHSLLAPHRLSRHA